jgi:hypothetical protein
MDLLGVGGRYHDDMNLLFWRCGKNVSDVIRRKKLMDILLLAILEN